MAVQVVHCARTHIPLVWEYHSAHNLEDLYIYYEDCQQMAVKGVVLTKSGKQSVWQKGPGICKKVPMGQQWCCWHGSGGRQKWGQGNHLGRHDHSLGSKSRGPELGPSGSRYGEEV